MNQQNEGRNGQITASGDLIKVTMKRNKLTIAEVNARSVRDANEIVEYWILSGIIDDSMNDGQA